MKKKNKKEFNIPVKIFAKKSAQTTAGRSSAVSFEKKPSNSQNWLLKKDEQTRKKAMWLIIGCLMALVIPVWIIFLQENMIIEKLSANEKNNEKYWISLKNNLNESIKNINDGISNFNKSEQTVEAGARAPSAKPMATYDQIGEAGGNTDNNEPADVSSEAMTDKVKIDNEKIEQLKEKLMEKK